MSKEVTVEELRERLDEIIADIKAGETVTILEDGRNIGAFEPFLVQRGVRFPFRNFDFGKPIPGAGDEAVRLLIEDRDRERSGKKYGL
jgi:hypothetical protein